MQVAQNGMDVVSETVEAFNRRDVPALMGLLAEDVQLLPFAAKLSGETYVGAEGIRRWLAELEDEWAEWRVELVEQRPIQEYVLSVGRIKARGRETDLELNLPAAFLSTVRDGSLVRLESFGDPAEALAAAGAA